MSNKQTVKPDALYHYCSTAAFVSMMEKRSLWMSSLSLANDTMEGRLFRLLLMQEANRRQMSAVRQRSLDEHLTHVEESFEGLAFCLSQERDKLSQWRGYANDGQGFAIGFSYEFLQEMCGTPDGPNIDLRPVIYDAGAQVLAAQGMYNALITAEVEEAFEPVALGSLIAAYQHLGSNREKLAPFLLGVLNGSMSFYGMKGNAFEEEREWRLLSVTYSNLTAQGTIYPLKHRTSGEKIVPYREVDFLNGRAPPLIEIIMGPRNPTPIRTVESFLVQCGFLDVPVRQSSASYRS